MTRDDALAELLRWLDTSGYSFTTVTPATHRLVARRRPVGHDLRDLLGWSLPVAGRTLPPEPLGLLEAAGQLERDGELVRSMVRVSRVGGRLFLHSAFPTDAADAVFLGPDTYRFVAFLGRELGRDERPLELVDMGAGSGAGGLCAAASLPGATITLVDINPLALRLAAVNAKAAGVAARTSERLPERFDLFIANPPFMLDPAGRSYRDGGDLHGAALSLDWVREAMRRLNPAGRILLYTGSAIVEGRDRLCERLGALAEEGGWALDYQEIDPDIFGEELAEPAYREVERIAAVGAVLIRR